VLATKGGITPGVPYDSSGLVAAAEASLRRLRTDVIDLYQVHRPDLLTHPAEVAAALDALVRAGKVRWVGVSNHTPAQLEALAAYLEAPLCTVQPELSALALGALDDGTLDQAMRLGLTPLAWSPLGGGRLLAEGAAAPQVAAVAAVLDELAAREGVDRAAVALAFVLAHPSRPVPIIGTQRPERIRAAAAAARVHLDRRDWYRIVAAAGRPLP
jgi:predicted oxidoreductase